MNLFNADETLLSVSGKNEVRLIRVRDGMRKAHQSKEMRLNTVGSMIPFVSANGEVLFIAFVIKAAEGSDVDFRIHLDEAVAKHYSLVRL